MIYPKLLAGLATATALLNCSFAASAANTNTPKPAAKCMSDLRDFDSQLQKDGYWMHGSGYGYGYPMEGFGMGMEMGMGAGMGGRNGTATPAPSSSSAARSAPMYARSRPGYEIRTLVVAANILAHRGQQQACEATLVVAHEVYKTQSAGWRNNDGPRTDMTAYRRQQIDSAKPVNDSQVGFRSDQLVGTDVMNLQGEEIGSIDDIVTSPTGKIAYLILERGGIFGFGEDHVPVPWTDFKVTSGASMFVLDSSKKHLEAAPRVKDDEFSPTGNFVKQSQQVDAYWETKPGK